MTTLLLLTLLAIAPSGKEEATSPAPTSAPPAPAPVGSADPDVEVRDASGGAFVIEGGDASTAGDPGGDDEGEEKRTKKTRSKKKKKKSKKSKKKKAKKTGSKKKKKKSKKSKKSKKASRRPHLGKRLFGLATLVPEIELALESQGVAATGPRKYVGAAFAGRLGFRPELRTAWGTLGTAMRYQQRATLGFTLPERRFDLDVYARVGPFAGVGTDLRLDVSRVLRQGWDDLYQPWVDEAGQPLDRYLATDRYSRWRIGGSHGWDFAFAPWAEARLSVRGARILQDHDPHYDPLLAPMHLTPRDRWEGAGSAEVSGTLLDRRWRYKLEVEAGARAWDYLYARDAKTGRTHAEPGDLPANPLRRDVWVSSRTRQSWWFKELRTRVFGVADYTYNFDLFESYRTWNQLVLKAGARTRPLKDLTIEASARGQMRLYTLAGYQEGPGHPPLEDTVGVRHDEWVHLEAETAYQLLGGTVELYLRGDFVLSETSAPDYKPYVFPSRRAYDIDRDARIGLIGVGIRGKL